MKANQVFLAYKQCSAQGDWVKKQNSNMSCLFEAITSDQSRLNNREVIENEENDSDEEEIVNVTNMEELMEMEEFRLFGQLKIVDMINQPELE